MTNREGILSKVGEGTALGRMGMLEMKGEGGSWYKPYYKHKPNAYKIPNSAYFEKCMSLNKLFCYKCMEQINIGDRYYRVFKRVRMPKYYHSSCFERMHY